MCWLLIKSLRAAKRVWRRLGRVCTSKCALRVTGPTAIFHVDATLRVHARRLGPREGVAHAARHRRWCLLFGLAGTTRAWSSHHASYRTLRGLSARSAAGRALCPGGGVRRSRSELRRAAWYDGPGRIRRENSADSSSKIPPRKTSSFLIVRSVDRGQLRETSNVRAEKRDSRIHVHRSGSVKQDVIADPALR